MWSRVNNHVAWNAVLVRPCYRRHLNRGSLLIFLILVYALDLDEKSLGSLAHWYQSKHLCNIPLRLNGTAMVIKSYPASASVRDLLSHIFQNGCSSIKSPNIGQAVMMEIPFLFLFFCTAYHRWLRLATTTMHHSTLSRNVLWLRVVSINAGLNAEHVDA